MAKRDPYAALRFKEFNIFLMLRFILVFGWSMQFIIIEWQVYIHLPKIRYRLEL